MGTHAMTEDQRTRIEWIAFACRINVQNVELLHLTDDQIYSLGGWIADNPLLNPPRGAPLKTGQFICRRCGSRFFQEYRTRHPHHCPRCK